MLMPGRQYTNGNSCRFGFNGQEKDNELTGVNGANTTAEFWEYDSRLGRRWNVDPVMKAQMSSYSCFADAPILLSDHKGDNLDVAKLYEKDKNGTLKNKKKVEAFELFASTNAGKKFLLSYAQKGFELKGQIIKGVNITATKEGENSKKGIDYVYTIGTTSEGNSYTSPTIEKNGRLTITTHLSRENEWGSSGKLGDLEDIATVAHESLLHGYLQSMRYKAGQRDAENIKGPDHTIAFTTSLYYSQGLSLLKTVQSWQIFKQYKEPDYSEDYIWYNIINAQNGSIPRFDIKH